MAATSKKTTSDDTLILYREMSAAQVRAVQRRLRAGKLTRIVPGVVRSLPAEDWPPQRRRGLAPPF